MKFNEQELEFELKIPEYEIPVFGYKVGELRLIPKSSDDIDILPFSGLTQYLADNEIKICTFRGTENIRIIRLLESVGFKFVSTYCIAECKKHEFTELSSSGLLNIQKATPDDYDEILRISSSVSDYSTFAIDPMIDKAIIVKRNAARTKSIFKKPNQCVYFVKIDGVIAGFIQYDIDLENKTAYTQSAAVHPDYQKRKVGESLFSQSIKTLLAEDIELLVNNSFSTQNIGSSKLHMKCNFKIVDHEIHMRYFNK